jgi:hypothetical protein
LRHVIVFGPLGAACAVVSGFSGFTLRLYLDPQLSSRLFQQQQQQQQVWLQQQSTQLVLSVICVPFLSLQYCLAFTQAVCKVQGTVQPAAPAVCARMP